MIFTDIIHLFASTAHTYHIIARNDKMILYNGSLENCRNTLNQESDDFRKTHIIVSEKKYSRIIRRKPII